ncbi:MAG: hypothetical protein ACW98F_02965, partial [Candidatus Hodarchaeales archaeon]
MVRDRFRPAVGCAKKITDQAFIHEFSEEPLSLTCYLHWYLAQKSDDIECNISLNPFSYIFHYENKYHLSSGNVWPLVRRIRWFDTNVVLFFHDSSLWPSIQEKFRNFRSLETNEETEVYNTYTTYKLSTETFNPGWSDLESVIRLPDSRIKIPKRYRHLAEGISFGYLKEDEIVSFAAAPHILKNKKYSFAIVRGIETK